MKKKLLIACGAACLLTSCATTPEKQFTLTGDVEGLGNTRIYIEHGRTADSVETINGHFEYWGGTLDEPNYIKVRSADNQWGCMFWAENSPIRISCDQNGKGEVTGSQTEDEYQTYRAHMASVWMEQQAVLKKSTEANINGRTEEAERLEQELEQLKWKADTVFMAFARKYPRSHVSFNHVYNKRVMDKYRFDRLNGLLVCLDTTAFRGSQWKTFKEVYAKDQRMQPGRPFPSFSFPDIFDIPVSLDSYKGKYLILTIGSCGLAEYESYLPAKKELYGKYREKGLEIVDILIEKNKDNMLKTIANNGIEWNLISDCKYWSSPIVRDWSIDHICQHFLIDRQGTVIARDFSPEELQSQVNQLFE